MLFAALPLVALHAALLASPPQPARPAPRVQNEAPDGRALFLANCARCHGENGDGKGVTQLDRPARSFRDGGFSYGNTLDALERTITYGIPGTPMPGFESSSTPAERRALAEFVRSLGPPGVEVDPAATVLVVKERPLVVRGMLPPITDGAPARPRGLLLGTLDGLTFEYSADDVRLLGVRAGGFVERRDWNGRGGDPLQPLGKLVHVFEGGQPRAMFFDSSAEPYTARLLGTWTQGSEVGLRYSLASPNTSGLVLRESVSAAGTRVLSGFRRVFTLESATGEETLFAFALPLTAIAAMDEIVARRHRPELAHAALAIRRTTGELEIYVLGSSADPIPEPPVNADLVRVESEGAARLEARGTLPVGTSLTLTVLSGSSPEPDAVETALQELGWR